MRRVGSTIILICLVVLINGCATKHGLNDIGNNYIIDESVQKIIMDFVKEKDFAGYIEFEDDGTYAINTCVSATLYDIGTNRCLTLIISRYPFDALRGTSYYKVNCRPVMCFNVGGKDVFVYNHSMDGTLQLFPQNSYLEKVAMGKEKTYTLDNDDVVIDDRFAKQTYIYQLDDGYIRIEKDSTFNLFQGIDK